MLREFLRENWDIFGSHPSDMPGIPRELAEHSLNILKGYKLVKQTLQRFSKPKHQAMGEELAKLIEAGFIREIKHPDWLANVVMVPKKDKSWCLCVDFKDLNKACPKDPFPSPALTRSLMLPQDTTHYASLTHISDTIKLKRRSLIKLQQHSSPHMGHSASTPCPSDSRTPAPLINA